METILNIWKSRCLSLNGKITIIKTLIVPQVQFLFSMIYVDDKNLKQIEQMLYNYIWNGKVHKVKKKTFIAPIEHGGLGMLYINSCNYAAKGSWIRRLLNPENSKWKNLTWMMLYIDKNKLINSNCLEHNINSKIPFHTQMLKAWAQINSFEPKSLKK